MTVGRRWGSSIGLFLCWFLLALPLLAQSPSGTALPVRDVTLDNGMRILILPREGAPTVSLVVHYDVGGANEVLGTTGIAHLLEHLLFKGTRSIGTRDFDAEAPLFAQMDALHAQVLAEKGGPRPNGARIEQLETRISDLEDIARQHVVGNEFGTLLSSNGARGLNATTTNEATIYYVDLPSNRLELWLALERDRMENPVFREFYTERDVVMEERRMRVDDSPGGLLYEAHLAAAYTMHPYGVPVVGYMSDLENLSRAKVEDYFQRYYGPNNAVVSIVGGIDADATETLARRYFGSLPRAEDPPPVLAVEPIQRGTRRITVEFEAEPLIRYGWKTVDIFHEDLPALVMLTSILTGGRTSRLYDRLVLTDGMAAQVTSSLGPGSRFPQLLQVTVVPNPSFSNDEIENAVREELENLVENGVSIDEVIRVRNQLRAGQVRRLQSNLGLALQLSESVTLYDDWTKTFTFSDDIMEVEPEDIRRVIRKYLVDSGLTVAVLERPTGGVDR